MEERDAELLGRPLLRCNRPVEAVVERTSCRWNKLGRTGRANSLSRILITRRSIWNAERSLA